MEKKLWGHVAIVTGAGQGIGFEIARLLIENGAKVVLNSYHQESNDEAVAKLNAIIPGCCVGLPGDSSDRKLIQEMVDLAVSNFGRLTLTVANTGVTIPGDFFSYKEEDFQKTMDINLKGTFFLVQAAALQMRKQQNGGSIVLMSSVNGEQANKHLGTYAMTKAAINMLAKNLVVELSPYNIRINCVSPGATFTERTLEDEQYEEAWSEVTPLGKVAHPRDIAYATNFLLSEEARHITGQNLVVDGGWTSVSPAPEGDTI
ncbi:SDR family NAD(P)-dependent oxidoreductase [Sphingobacterium paludis]|uniref:3-oxoacyl-[acyl-carrier protein] reductase n=1 Tax=Sphingobacterium paludis TaxID=1476465 RepID=A0A4R7CYH1_9SPHI|nr:SDR family oxidoreductase [Sphingobacterium paludis]TDS12942.1 3-oxoacyl-[acyl-carrier protein] reductase [Sphingobacterium paludis]